MRIKLVASLLFWFTACNLTFLLGCKSSKSKSDSDPDSINDKNSLVAKRDSINNLKQLVLAMANYQSAYGTFPSPGPKPETKEKPEGFSSPYSWRVECLPYIEQANFYNLVMQDRGGPLPESVKNAQIKLYQHPSGDKSTPLHTHYRVFVGNGAAFEYGRGLGVDEFKDGLPNTILIVEAAEPVDWWKVEELEYDPKKPLPKLGVFDGGFYAAMGDGVIRWIPSDTDEKILRAMITRSGGEKVTLPGKGH
jgi:Protein of unknown function (DUF1559)